MSVVGRSPFEYLLNAPAGGGFAAAFQEGEAAASRQATEASMRAESALRQREAGLRLGEFQAEAPLRAAERQRMLGLYQDQGEAPAARLPGSDLGAVGLPSWLIGRESGGNFGAINADTGASGRGQFMESRLADARRAGVIPENMTLEQFRRDPTAQMRVEQWHVSDINNFIARNQLDQYVGQTVAGVPITPNGMLAVAHLGGSTGLKKFLETGGRYNPADANGTRLSDYMRLGAQAQGVQPQAAPQAQTQARPAAQLPAGALGEGFLRSPAGVPMTVPEGDLPPAGPNAAPAQFMVPGPGGMQPVPAPGTPAPSGARSPFTRLPGAAPIGGPVEPSQPFTDWLAGQAAASQGAYQAAVTPGTAPTATAPTRPADQLLGGATAIVPVGLSPAMGGGTPLGGAISPTPMAAQVQGLLATRPTAAPAGAPAAPAALPAAIPGLTVAGPAMLGLQQIQEQRARLQRQYDRVRLAPPGERAALRSQIEAANDELRKQERNFQVDIAVGQLSMGQWQPIDSILRQTYGVQVRPVEAGGRVAGYELVQGGRAVARLTPEQLGSQVRLGLSQTFAQQEAARNQAKFETELKGLEEAMKQEARMTAEVVIESARRKYPDMKVEKINDETIYVYDNRGNQTMMTLSDRDERGEKLPKGSPKRWVATRMQIGQVPVR